MKILIPIDGSEGSLKAVRLVANLFGTSPGDDLSLTLLHVVESLPDHLLAQSVGKEPSREIRQIVDEWSQQNAAHGEELLNVQKRVLLDAGIPESSVSTKLVVKDALPEAKSVVAAISIIEEMDAGPYSIVCVGRRGQSATSGIFPGSIAEKVLRAAAGKTVWVVD